MSEKMKYCGGCDRSTPHEHWSKNVTGGRADLADRLLEGLMTMGISELVNEKYCRCLRCGRKRRLQ